ncbi:MAG: hypothetical protein ACPG1Z_11095 [Planctomycetota bacterium]
MNTVPKGWFVVRDSLPETARGASGTSESPGGHELRLDLWKGDLPDRLPKDLGPVIVTDRGGAISPESGARTSLRNRLCQRPEAWLDVDPLKDAPPVEGIPWILSRHLEEDSADVVHTVIQEARERGACAAKVVLPETTPLKRRLEVLLEAAKSDFPCVAFAMSRFNHSDRLWAMESGQPWGYLNSDNTGSTIPGLPKRSELAQRYRWQNPGSDLNRYLIFGRDVRHSLSPDWHNRLFTEKGIAARFYPWSTDNPETDLQAWTESGFKPIQGLAITAPHKQWARQAGDGIHSNCELHSAWNTLVHHEGIYQGTSTDGPGALALFEVSLGGREALQGKRVAILGRGGAAQSVATTFAAQNMEVVLHCRPGKRHESGLSEDRFTISDQPTEIATADLLINATGSDAEDSPEWPWSLELFQGEAALEMDYSRGETAFEKTLKQGQGIEAWSGFDFFASQACLQAQHLYGIEVSLHTAIEMVREIRQERARDNYPVVS